MNTAGSVKSSHVTLEICLCTCCEKKINGKCMSQTVPKKKTLKIFPPEIKHNSYNEINLFFKFSVDGNTYQ